MNGCRVVTAEDFELHDRSFYQSARTVGGRVAEPPLREADAWRYARDAMADAAPSSNEYMIGDRL